MYELSSDYQEGQASYLNITSLVFRLMSDSRLPVFGKHHLHQHLYSRVNYGQTKRPASLVFTENARNPMGTKINSLQIPNTVPQCSLVSAHQPLSPGAQTHNAGKLQITNINININNP
jgi:hypothetical protein